MRTIEPIPDEEFEEHKKKFNDPDHFRKYFKGNAIALWGTVWGLRAHPASAKLFLDRFVEEFLKENSVEDLSKRFFEHNLEVHEAISQYIYPRSRVLDLGAGIGCLKRVLDSQGKEVEYFASDISHRLLDLNPAREDRKLCCEFGDLYKLTGGRRFDIIVDCNATHYRDYKGSNHQNLLDRWYNLCDKYIFCSRSQMRNVKRNELDLSRYPEMILIPSDKFK